MSVLDDVVVVSFLRDTSYTTGLPVNWFNQIPLNSRTEITFFYFFHVVFQAIKTPP